MQFVLFTVVFLSFGSFGNNLISYFIKQSGLELKRSVCICGERNLKMIELIPLLSFFALRGKCQTCKTKLPVRFVIIEAIVGAIGLLAFYKFGLTTEFVINFLILFALVLIGVIDLIKYIIPNELIIFLLLALLFKLILIPYNYLINIITSASIIAILLLLRWAIFKISKQEALGMGDVKFVSVLALLFGFPLSIIGIWLSSILGLLGLKLTTSRANPKIPFGFFLSIGFILVIFFEQQILSYYYKLIF